MKYKWKKPIALSLAVCLLGMTTTACRSLSPVEAETKLEEPMPIADEPDAADSQAPETLENNESDMADDQTQETPKPDEAEGTDSDADQTQPSTQDNADASADTENSGKWHVNAPDVAAAVDADFEGVVHKLAADSFFISPTETIIEEDGSLTAVSISPDAEIPEEDLVKVVFDDNTVFTLRNIYDGGARYEDSDAAFQNVEKALSVSLKGEFQNDVFHADKIRIIKIH